MDKLKQEAVEVFQKHQFDEAIAKFSECLELDPLNINYNSTILFNRASAYQRLSKNVEAIADLTKATEMNEDYMKAFLKRGELHMLQKNYEEAVRDFERVKALDQSVQGLREKIQHAKVELKKSKRKDYYKILGVEQNANDDEIKKAYKKGALKWHPDKHQNDDDENKKTADSMFKDIGEAYEILQDSQKRRRYDQGADLEELQGGGGGGGHMDPNDIFQMFFAGGGGPFGGHGGHGHGTGGQTFSFGSRGGRGAY